MFASVPLSAQTQAYTISTVAGNGTGGFAEGSGTSAQFNNPLGIAVSGTTLYVADQLNNAVRTINLTTGAVTTVAGTRAKGFGGNDGPPLQALLQNPAAVAVASNGYYISDFTNKEVRSVIGNVIKAYVSRNSVPNGFSGDGALALDAQTGFPYGIAVDSTNILYLADSANNRIRRITPDGIINTIAGFGEADYSGDGALSKNAGLNHPDGVALFGNNILYVADTLNHVIRRVVINPTNYALSTITTIAGTGERGYSGDGGLALTAKLNNPESIAVDSNGFLYIADTLNHVIRRVIVNAADPTKSTISTIAGINQAGYSGDGGAARAAQLNFPRGIAVDADGSVFISDTANSVVRKLTAAAGGTPPEIFSQGVISASDFGFSRSVAPGSWIEIYGTNLSNQTRGWTASDFTGLKAPTSLNGVRVTVGGKDAYVSYVSPGQVNALLPFDVPIGGQNVVVSNGAVASLPIQIVVNTLQSQVYAPLSFKSGTQQYVAGFLPDGKVAFPADTTSLRRARAGEVMTLYGVGFGPVTPAQDSGTVVQTANTVNFPITVAFNHVQSVVLEQGLAVGSIGLYYVKVIVPSGVVGDNVLVLVAQAGFINQVSLLTAIGN